MVKIYQKKLISFVFIGFVLATLPFSVQAVSQGDTVSFNIESNYDINSRNKVEAVLQRITNQIYFYIEKDWWEKLSQQERSLLDNKLYNLSTEFEYNIYPETTRIFGPWAEHPVDKSGKLTILFHQMPGNSGGYFSSGDQYSKHQYFRSNEKHMIYINADFMGSSLLRGFLAHEFMHLITFNAKEKTHNVREEIWLNEARAEYMPTFFNYDSGSESNLLRRKSTFINSPENSLTEWLNRADDYGSVNLFTQYLVEHYGINILADSLKSEKTGIPSINEALKKNGYQEDFGQIFSEWTVAVLVNDCSLGKKYCYNNENLKDLKIVPITHYLPTGHGGSFTSRRSTKNWSGNWYRVVGGKGDLRLDFQAESKALFQVPYVLCKKDNSCRVNFISLNSNGRGFIEIKNFDQEYSSLIIVPSAQNKTTGFNGAENPVYFSWGVTTAVQVASDSLREALLNQIKELEKEVVRLQAILSSRSNSCLLTQDLALGTKGQEVICLQEFLKAESVYPEALITGNFLSLTHQAVVRFQEKYFSEILAPLGLTKGTGYVGLKTREKINQISSSRR
jgi:hypothetical protein